MNVIEATLLSNPLTEGWWERLSAFMSQGGQVLWVLAAVVVITWLLVFERILFLSFSWPSLRNKWLGEWQTRRNFESWHAHAVKAGMLSQAHIALNQNMNLIKALVAICPMLGLLGTVTGMISVFDIMSSLGSSQPKLMASGISMATLPTMAGMVAALAGMFVHARLMKACDMREIKMEKLLRSGEQCV
ncbi:MotA/TolQ/ExbB proton channel family protein [Thaumasiovibrio subtropicus]|uniref:MotA/TolQ/ExbB proton channel family protein n=1 Tax=Thaumasiovibrio subtropicus TaxID=1891207 RepID=UPI000B34AEDD|nr:MotA/TolQ/ExbB proton channel family protein [Thaumasiovibrio subtropicus]